MKNQRKIFMGIMVASIFLLFSCEKDGDDKPNEGAGIEKVEREGDKVDEASPVTSIPKVSENVEKEDEKGSETMPSTNTPKATVVPDGKRVQIKLNPAFDKSFRPSEYNEGKYDVTDGLLTVGKNELVFPKIVNISNHKKQQEINSLIRNKVDNYLKNRLGDPVKGGFIKFEYTTKFASDNLLSLLFEVIYYLKGAAHPSKFSFFINVDLEEGVLLKNDDIMPVTEETEEIKRLFKDNKLVDRDEDGVEFYKYLMEPSPNEKEEEEGKKNWEKRGRGGGEEYINGLFNEIDVGFSGDYIEFVFSTASAVGGYMVLGLPIELLE